jgi:3-hydroxyanthranilate 3,4-dioxygenase
MTDWSKTVNRALENLPINLDRWIEENKATLRPPIGNREFWKGEWQNLLVMMVGGPNYRPDYHDDPGEELFIQLRGDLTLKLLDPVTRDRSEVIVREREMYLLPAHVRHSPQRPEGCVGLVVERYRQPGEVDALEWYDDEGNLEFRGEFLIENIERDLAKVQAAWSAWKQQSDRQTPKIWRVGATV